MTFVPYNSYPAITQEMYDLLAAFLSEEEFNAFMADFTILHQIVFTIPVHADVACLFDIKIR